MARIVTVYTRARREFRPADMAHIRWLKISEALSRRGHRVDIATNEAFTDGPGGYPVQMSRTLRRVCIRDVRWSDYEVVKTLFNAGFETLEARGGTGHPFIISKLGSVVGPEDREGIYFYGNYRRELFANQERIARVSAYVTLLSEAARDLWESCFGPRGNVLLVPGAADARIPPPGADPFPENGQRRCLFAGHIYFKDTQPEANEVLVEKLNRLGGLLSAAGIRLYMIGSGDVSNLDPGRVTYLGSVPHEHAWSYMQHAHVGVVVAAGPYMHNNESSKIYHYLRAGLPVVSEAGFPNDHVLRESRLGVVVQNGDLELMARTIAEAAHRDWDREFAVRYILAHHTWDQRAEVYDRLLRSHFG